MNEARFALLQRSLDAPEVEKLRRAFRSVECLTPADAPMVARDAFGILVRNLDAPDAMTLQQALRTEGIDTAVVLQSDLPELPPVKFVRRMDCQADALVLFDPIGREIPVTWDNVGLIAAGQVWTSVFQQEQKAPPQTPWDSVVLADGLLPGRRGYGGAFDPPPPETVIREKQAGLLVLDLILAGATMRFQTEADKFLFNYLGDRKTGNVTANFTLLVRDLLASAPQALVNRGAFYLREEPPTLFEYPSKNAYIEEMTWLLWRAREAAQSSLATLQAAQPSRPLACKNSRSHTLGCTTKIFTESVFAWFI